MGSGLLRKKRDSDGKRERTQSEVPCPVQNKAYSETFHLIDKGNGAEAKYDMGGHSKTHNWAPKLTMRYFNMNFNNSMKIYNVLTAEHTPHRRTLFMPDCISELSHALMQHGKDMRVRAPDHPDHKRDIKNAFDTGSGQKIRSDAKGFVSCSRNPVRPPAKLKTLNNLQRKATWRIHQSKVIETRGKCAWMGCPGIKESKRKGVKRPRPYDTYMQCEECSARHGKTMRFCNNIKSGTLVHCHEEYHNKYCNKTFPSDGL